MNGDIRKNSEIQMSKTSLRTTKEITVSNPDTAREIAEKITRFLFLAKRYMQRGTITKQSNVIASVNIF